VANGATVTEFIRAVPLFAGLQAEELNRVAAAMQLLDVVAGELICAQGDPGYQFYVIAGGEAVVERHGQPVAKLHAGDYFGELALLDRGPRSATVRALTDCRLFVLHKQSFTMVLEEMPVVAQKLLGVLASRLREAEARADRVPLD
jgi:CRP/FNR family transcriptional regulator, cyclic AMP receptor protein